MQNRALGIDAVEALLSPSLRPRVLLLPRKNNNSGDAPGANKGRAILHNCPRVYRRRNQEMSQLFGSGRANFTLYERADAAPSQVVLRH